MSDISDAQYRHQQRLVEEADLWFSNLGELHKMALNAEEKYLVQEVQNAIRKAINVLERTPFRDADDFLIGEPNSSDMLALLAKLKIQFQQMEDAVVWKRWNSLPEFAFAIMSLIEKEEDYRTAYYDAVTGDL